MYRLINYRCSTEYVIRLLYTSFFDESRVWFSKGLSFLGLCLLHVYERFGNDFLSILLARWHLSQMNQLICSQVVLGMAPRRIQSADHLQSQHIHHFTVMRTFRYMLHNGLLNQWISRQKSLDCLWPFFHPACPLRQFLFSPEIHSYQNHSTLPS